ncbi:MAG: hypothetical protein ACI4KM_02550 [Oscillospiraceae bacterium]
MTFGELKENKSYTITSEMFGTIELNICQFKGEYSSGINNLTDLKWISYSIDWTKSQNIPEHWRKYNKVIFSPYRIGEKGRQEASQRIVLERVSMIKDREHYHIDGKSGNIHPPFQESYEFNSAEIKQLVLCKPNTSCDGPRNDELFGITPCELYSWETEKKKITRTIYIPKACYYPLIDENDEENVKGEFGYQFLKKIWEEIHK